MLEQASAGLRWHRTIGERFRLHSSIAIARNIWQARQTREVIDIAIDNGNVSQFVITSQKTETRDSFGAVQMNAGMSYAINSDSDVNLSIQLQKGDEYEGAFVGLGLSYRL